MLAKIAMLHAPIGRETCSVLYGFHTCRKRNQVGKGDDHQGGGELCKPCPVSLELACRVGL
jgi:hypothetical protein